MFRDFTGKKRTIIPRWRDFQTTLELGELRPAGALVPTGPPPNDATLAIKELKRDWEKNRTLAFATDLLGAGLSLGIVDGNEEAAEFVLSRLEATRLQRRIALQATGNEPSRPHLVTNLMQDPKELVNTSRERIAKLRKELRTSLVNPIRLVELALEFATLGSTDKAIRSMEIAVALAPANRYVIRSAVRLFVHTGELERAHFILRRAESLKNDPWLLAAEIGVASMRNQSSKHMKIGLDLIESSRVSTFHTSELASAVATMEMKNASNKRAKRLFRLALVDPTDNSVAQAEWASRQMSGLEVFGTGSIVPRNFEAPAWDHWYKGELHDAIRVGKEWLFDQPFAASPVMFTSMVANHSENFPLAQDILYFGLRANPNDFMLRNNLAFSLASNGQIDEAEQHLNRIERLKLSGTNLIVVTATDGLIQFRRGDYAKGRSLYRSAIEIAKKEDKRSYAFRAQLFLAREETVARSEFAHEAVKAAENEAKHFIRNNEIDTILKRLRSRVEAVSDPSTPRKRTTP